MADSEVDTTQQVTSQTPATKQKNPKRVAAGKATAEKTKQAHEAQKKKMAEYEARENDQMKTGPPAVSAPEPPAAAEPPPAAAEPPADVSAEITTTQWLTAISIIVSLAGLYYKREEIKGLLTPKAKTPPPSPALPRAPPPSPVAPKRGKMIEMD